MTMMLTNQQALVAALDRAYKGVDPCHCHGNGKLDRDELVSCLVRYGALDQQFAPPPATEPSELTEANRHARRERMFHLTGEYYTFEHEKIYTVEQLCSLTMADLLRI